MPDDNLTDGETEDTDIKAPESVFQKPDDIFNPRTDEETLDQDGDAPATAADTAPQPEVAQPDHPEKDYASDRDSQEIYDEGEDAATDNLTVREADTQAFPLEPSDDDDGDDV